MLRLIAILLIVYLLSTLFLRFLPRLLALYFRSFRKKMEKETPTRKTADGTEPMVPCSSCGTFTLRSRAIATGKGLFCTMECAGK